MWPTNLQRQDFLTKTERVAAALRQGILSGHFKAGTQLLQEETARQLRVSATPVREAFSILEAEGFIERRPHHGVTVREWNYRQIEDVYELRRVVENFGIRRCVKNATSVDLDELEALIAAAKRAIHDKDIQRARQANLRFHGKLMRMSGSEPLVNIMDALLAASQYYVPRSEPTLHKNSDDHRLILEAIRRRDADKAADLLGRHMNRSVMALKRYHREVRSAAPGRAVDTSGAKVA
jgi:DNA-binding GntR family transcriptional regulator